MPSDELKNQIRNAYKRAKKVVPDFKPRSSQNLMIAEITKTLSNHECKNIVIEAPTGVGKTYDIFTFMITESFGNLSYH